MEYAKIKYRRAGIERGYTGRLLMVDLGERRIEAVETPARMREQFVGGRGYCLKLVYDGTGPGTAPESAENVLAMSGGPFCGESGFVGTGKFVAGAVSPLTGAFCDSNVGGHFFAMVKLSGFDAIAVTGRSDDELLLVIDGDSGEVRLVAAPEMESSLTNAERLVEQFREGLEPWRVALVCAGMGARNTSYGCINSVYYDKRRGRLRSKQAGRGGLGSVMRAKGLWGIVVRRDESFSNLNKPADRRRVSEAGKQLRRVIAQVDPGSMRLGTQGTTSLLDMMNKYDLLPVKNYQYGRDDREPDVSGDIFEDKVFKQDCPDGCFPGCNLACTKGCERHLLKTGPRAGEAVAVDGPEYETAAAVTNLGVFDIDAMLEYAWYCDEYGIDTISVGVTMAFAYEAAERGYLDAEDLGGRTLEWGDAQGMLKLVHEIAAGVEGLPRRIGGGIRRLKDWIAGRAAARLGRPGAEVRAELDLFAMECKGLEFSMYVTKESLAQQGGYGFALKGPQHDEAWLIAIDQLHNEIPTFENKAAALKWFPLFRTWFNIVGLCKLPWIDVRHPDAKNTDFPARNMPTIAYYLDLVNGTFGSEKTLTDLLDDSERCYTLHKIINLRQGFGLRDHDRIPLRAMAPVFVNEFVSRRDFYIHYMTEVMGALTAGRSDEELLVELQEYRRRRYEKLMDVVYEEKGYDADGIPLDRTLERLGLDEPGYFEDLEQARRRARGRS